MRLSAPPPDPIPRRDGIVRRRSPSSYFLRAALLPPSAALVFLPSSDPFDCACVTLARVAEELSRRSESSSPFAAAVDKAAASSVVAAAAGLLFLLFGTSDSLLASSLQRERGGKRPSLKFDNSAERKTAKS